MGTATRNDSGTVGEKRPSRIVYHEFYQVTPASTRGQSDMIFFINY